MLPSPASFLPLLLLYPSLLLVFLPINAGFGHLLGALATLLAAFALFLNAPVILVSEGRLSVKNARIQIGEIAKTVAIDRNEAFEERTSRLDSRAYLVIKSSVPTYLKIFLKSNPDDQTPYWLVSTRRSTELKKLLDSKD
ncbi:MAG: hypothetical protein RLZZ590_115 [Actinomycetota bacterium]